MYVFMCIMYRCVAVCACVVCVYVRTCGSRKLPVWDKILSLHPHQHSLLLVFFFIYLFDIFSHIYIYTHTYIFTYSAVGYFMECKVKNWGFEGKLVCSALSPGSFLQGFSLSKGILCNGSSLPYEFDFK